MRLIVSDSSCLIDLRKADLLPAFVELPYELVVPDVLVDQELLCFSKSQLALIRRRMTVASLEGPGVERVGEVQSVTPALSLYDCFAYVVAEERPGSILLTGDRRLRTLAKEDGMEVHGVLWAVEQLAEHRKAPRKVLVAGLETLRADPSARLPKAALGRLISELRRKR
jgi:predicted nucleic acid-binding protein